METSANFRRFLGKFREIMEKIRKNFKLINISPEFFLIFILLKKISLSIILLRYPAFSFKVFVKISAYFLIFEFFRKIFAKISDYFLNISLMFSIFL